MRRMSFDRLLSFYFAGPRPGYFVDQQGGFVSRLTKHLVWTPATESAPENARTQFALTATLRAEASAKPGIMAAPSNLEALDLDIALPAREQAVYLLHVGAEVEHALMAQ